MLIITNLTKFIKLMHYSNNMRKILRKKEIRELKGLIKEEILKKSKIEFFSDEDGEFILADGEIALFKHKEWVLTLHSIIKESNEIKYKEVIVDAGAIKFVVNGADVMRPGITKIDNEIEKDEVILIREETHNKPLAFGIALLSVEEMNAATSGKVVKSLHYVGDNIWNRKKI
jgi:PUA-domain protein